MPTLSEVVFAITFGTPDTKNLDKAEKKAIAAADKVAKEWKDAAKEIGAAFKTVGIAAAAAAAGVAALTVAAADQSFELDKWAKTLDTSTQALQRLQFAGAAVGAESDNVIEAVKTLRENLGELERVGTGPAEESLKTLGLTMADFAGLGIEEQMGVLSEAMKKLPNQAQRISVALELMGEDGRALIPMFAEGAEGIKNFGAEAERMGAILSEDTIKSGVKLTKTIKVLKGVLGTAGAELLSAFSPALTQAAEGIQRWIVANRDLIATRVEKFIEQATDAVRTFWPLVSRLIGLALDLVSALGPGGAAGAFVTLKVAMAGSLGPIGLVATALGTISLALINIVSDSQDARIALDNLAAGGLNKRRIGAKFAASPEEAALVSKLSKAEMEKIRLEKKFWAGDGRVKAQRGVIITIAAELKEQRRKDATAAKNKKAADTRSKALITQAKKDAATLSKAFGDAGLAFDTGKASLGRGVDAVSGLFKPGEKKKGRGTGKVPTIDTSAAEALVGEQVRALAAEHGLGETAVQSAIETAQASLTSGALGGVARGAAVSRLSGLAGKDLNKKDRSFSEILMDSNVPDIGLSAIARGAEPQTLISNIYNTFAFDNDFMIEGAGDPSAVAREVTTQLVESFQGSLDKSTKTAKVNMAR